MHKSFNLQLEKFLQDFQIKKILRFTGKIYQYTYKPKGYTNSFQKKYYYCEVELINGIKKILSIPEEIFQQLNLKEKDNEKSK